MPILGVAMGSRAKISVPGQEMRLQSSNLRLGIELATTVLLLGGAAMMAILHPWVERPDAPILVTLKPLLIFLAYPLALAFIEFFFPAAGPRKSAWKWLMNFNIIASNLIISIPLVSILLYYETKIFSLMGFETGLIKIRYADVGIIGLIATFLIYSFIFDFFFYWSHRIYHKVPFLWANHKFHHIDREFDALTSQRNNWVDATLGTVLITLPATVLFGIDENNIVGEGIFYTSLAYGLRFLYYINHSSLRMQFGRFSVIWMSAQTHRIHHSLRDEHRDKNFAAWFPLWDIIFGTYYHPKKDEFPETGVDDEKEISSFWEAQTFPLREWWKMIAPKLRPGNGPPADGGSRPDGTKDGAQSAPKSQLSRASNSSSSSAIDPSTSMS